MALTTASVIRFPAPRTRLRVKKRKADPVLDDVLRLIEGRSAREISEASGGIISNSAIYAWRSGKVRRPVNYTLDAALKAVGYRRVIVPIA